MLMENVMKIHEDSLCGSLDYKISEFILLNTYEMSQYSLGDIAREVDLPKSSVASFFSSGRFAGGYPMFQRTLRTEIGRQSVTLNVFMRHIRTFLNRTPRHLRMDHDDAYSHLAEELFHSRKVIFLGPKNLRESFSPLQSLLWKKKISCRYIVLACAPKYVQELSELGDDDLVIMISPHENYREFKYYLNSFPHIAAAVDKCKGRHLYFLSDPSGAEDNSSVITITSNANPAEIPTAANIVMLKLFEVCIKQSGMDLSQQICII